MGGQVKTKRSTLNSEREDLRLALSNFKKALAEIPEVKALIKFTHWVLGRLDKALRFVS